MHRFQSSVTNDSGCLWQLSRRRRAAPRRGNTIVLVVGILVLLVIIATAYISRTHAGRVTAAATQRANLRDDNAQVIADSIASEIAEALFVRPIAFAFGPAGAVPDSNAPRLPILPDALRYDFDPDYPYNFAPYHVVPFTNWLDEPPGTFNPQWPEGPGSPDGLTHLPPPFNAIPIGAGNPLGNPGFGDTRWLAGIEPLRWDTDGDGILDAFSHWRHMTNIARPGNGWRIVGDISIVVKSLVTDLSIPVEQQLAVRSNAFHPVTGLPSLRSIGIDNFFDRWQNWLGGPGFGGYPVAYTNPLQIPPNFLDLKDLDGDGVRHNFGDGPQDEFIPGTARHAVSSMLADADGDGFTDSFYFLAPTMIERGIRQIVAIRIIDNSAMLNANVATRFLRSGTQSKTTGATPADLALVGRAAPGTGTDNWNVGFYDNPDHDNTHGVAGPYAFDYLTDRWERHVTEVGLVDPSGDPIVAPDAATRLEYWRSAGRAPFSATAGLTPFTLADELELRMFHGQNYPWIFSRYEYSVQSENGGPDDGFLRGSTAREESSEYLDQLTNQMLAADNRRKLTLFSGARNDLMPPWLRWRWEIPADIDALATANPADNDGNGVADVIDRFLAQARTKLDLREPDFVIGPPPPPGVRNFRDRLAPTLLLALTDGAPDPTNVHEGDSYYGDYNANDTAPDSEFGWLQRMAAGLSANIREYRDENSDVSLADAEPLPELTVAGPGPGPAPGADLRMLGMEKQPFLVEAFIGHVYKGQLVNFNHDQGPDQGDHILCATSPNSTIVVVQIANPFDSVLELADFRLRVFHTAGDPNEVALGLLPVNSIAPGSAMTLYSIEDQLAGEGLAGPWRIELGLVGLGEQNQFAGGQEVTLSSDRTQYDNVDEERAIELVRMLPEAVVLDRIDVGGPGTADYEFGEEVAGMDYAVAGDCTEPPVDLLWPDVVNIGGDTHWVQWVRVTRAWDDDFNAPPGITNEEKNPRYVFADRDIEVGEDSYLLAGNTINDFAGESHFNEFDKQCDSCDPLHFAMQMLQKDGDFEQVGELLNVWLFGHELDFSASPPSTMTTFSEFMRAEIKDGYEDDDDAAGVSRLRVSPTETTAAVLGPQGTPGLVLSSVIGRGDAMDLTDPLHAVPALPAGLRVLDAFVCDGRGVNGVVNQDEFRNASGFTGKTTPGLININTATVEVMRALPHMTRMVHEVNPPIDNLYVRIPEAIVQRRERFNGIPPMDPNYLLYSTGIPSGADYSVRPGGLRPERGYASIGELMLLMNPAQFVPPLPLLEPNENWLVNFAALRPAALGIPGAGVESTQISTDVSDVFDPITMSDVPDQVAQDVEEQNLLFAGISNLITTRSDMFTVYFKIRSFRQNPVTGIWDATDPEYIVDDSRYVMLVDRSEVNRPTDKPKILYLEKLPK